MNNFMATSSVKAIAYQADTPTMNRGAAQRSSSSDGKNRVQTASGKKMAPVTPV